MKNITTFAASLVALLSLFGCTSSTSVDEATTNTTTETGLLESKLQRETDPQIDETSYAQFIQDNNTFAIDLYNKLYQEESNLFFSPLSVSEAVAMTYAGAHANTKTEMAQALHFTLDDTNLSNAFNKLDLSLNTNDEENAYTFSVANAIWPEKSFSFHETYLDTLKTSYGAGLNLMDYLNDPEGSRERINSWVAEKTYDKIQDLLKEGTITTDTKLVLANAVYFKGAWENKFVETTKETFTLLNGTTKEIDMMYQENDMNYFENDNFQAVMLPYKSYKSSMVILLPKNDEFIKIADFLNHELLDSLDQNKTYANVKLSLPKFEFTTDNISLKSPLIELGMQNAFTDSADFSNMTSSDTLVIDNIMHKAYIKVDENGTEAAAATSISLGVTGIIENAITKVMRVNRPFIFFIKDNATGQILFLGHIIDPS